jgi:hypothetical protein
MSRIAVRSILGTALLAASQGCTAAGDGQWRKAGADQQTIARDNAECRDTAQDEALRRYPYRATSLGVVGQQRDDNARTVAEASLFNSCMQTRGYTR